MAGGILLGGLTDPVEPVVIDIHGHGAVGSHHDPHLTALVQNVPGGLFDILPGAGVDDGILGKAAEDWLAPKELPPSLRETPSA